MLKPPDLYLRFGAVAISAHVVFEAVAYVVGFGIYRRDRRKFGDVVDEPDRHWVIVAAVLGAAVGSKLLAGLEDPKAVMEAPWTVLLGGKTIVGGLLGGTAAVEWTKRRLGIRPRTGDLFAIPMAAAIAIGRVGCFFAGMGDHTYGSPTNLPWRVDFGDGIGRHPTQLYEIVFLIMLAFGLGWLRPRLRGNGELFRIFLVSYLGWRLAIDFLKPEAAWMGLSAIQWACALALLFYARGTMRMFSPKKEAPILG